MKQKRLFLKFLLVISGLSFSLPVFAYLDPGTGSLLIQGAIAAVAALALTLKLYWHRLLVMLGVRKHLDLEEENEQTERPVDDSQEDH